MGETFKAECADNQLIMVTDASYGMMERNRCIQPTDDTGIVQIWFSDNGYSLYFNYIMPLRTYPSLLGHLIFISSLRRVNFFPDFPVIRMILMYHLNEGFLFIYFYFYFEIQHVHFSHCSPNYSLPRAYNTYYYLVASPTMDSVIEQSTRATMLWKRGHDKYSCVHFI